MTTVNFDVALFKTRFPQFANTADAVLQVWWDQAVLFSSNQTYYNINSKDYQQLNQILMLLTAHIGVLTERSTSGNDSSGFVTSATIDSTSVSISAPPVENGSNFQYWLTLTPYGLQASALINIRVKGGLYILRSRPIW